MSKNRTLADFISTSSVSAEEIANGAVTVVKLANTTSSNGTSLIQMSGHSTALNITPSGRIGIGTTNPAYTLVVSEDGNDNIEIGAGIIQRYNRGTSSYGAMNYYSASHNFYTSGGGQQSLFINSDGNVGISTASPDVLLDVGDSDHGSAGIVGIQIQSSQDFSTTYDGTNGSTWPGVQIVNHDDTSNRTAAGITFVHRSSSSGIAAIQSTSDAADRADIRFVTRGTGNTIAERVIIDYDGNVGIGTTGPSDLLHVYGGSLRLQGAADGAYAKAYASGGDLYLESDPGNTGGSSKILFTVDGTERGRFDSNGDFLVGSYLRWDTTGNYGLGTLRLGSGTITSVSPMLWVSRNYGDITNPLVKLDAQTNDGRVLRVESNCSRTDMDIMDVLGASSALRFAVRGDGVLRQAIISSASPSNVQEGQTWYDGPRNLQAVRGAGSHTLHHAPVGNGEVGPRSLTEASATTSNGTWANLKSFSWSSTHIPSNSPAIFSVAFESYNQSGAYYYTWRLYNAREGAYVPLFEPGYHPENYLSSGGGITFRAGGSVHSYATQPWVVFDAKDCLSGDTIYLQLCNSNGNGSTLNQSSQVLYVRRFYVHHGIVTGINYPLTSWT
jgi:hypothetical protein